MKTKKAISDIVSTVLIIMIAVAAVGIIGAIVVPMVRNSLQGGTACLAALSDVSIETQGTCITKDARGICTTTGFEYNASATEDNKKCYNSTQYSQTDGNFIMVADISVQVRKGSDASVNLEKLVIQVMDDTGSSEPREITDPSLSLGQIKVFNVGNVSNDAKSITLAPVVKIGNSAKQCDASTSQVTLVPCN
jgi:hypothetical protein